MINYDNFFLPVDSLDEAKEFYKKLDLAVKFDFSDNGMIAYRVGEEEPAIILKDKAKFPDAKPAIWFVVESVKDEVKKLRERGVRFISEPFQIRTGQAAEFEDPFGNRLGITDYSGKK